MGLLPPSQPASESIIRSAFPRRSSPAAQTSNACARLIAALALAVVSAVTFGGYHRSAAAAENIAESSLKSPANFITCMATSPSGKTIAVGTEGHGLLIFQPNDEGSGTWRVVNRKSTPGFRSNNVYSLCFDTRGRLWVGTLRGGVEVGIRRGSRWHWRDYAAVADSPKATHANSRGADARTFNGPLGVHVFAIAQNPLNGSMWIATESGISIYAPRKPWLRTDEMARRLGRRPDLSTFGQWRYITPTDGLPPSPPDCIAFGRRGRAFVGTQCDGLCVARFRDHYQRWRIVRGPRRPTTHPFGAGLPSSLINCVLVTRGAGTVYVGTDWGLAVSHNNGDSWRFERGRDYAAKVLGRTHPPAAWNPPAEALLAKLLPGDHVNCLAEDARHRLWIGFWRNGFICVNPKTGRTFRSSQEPAGHSLDGYVSALLPLRGGMMIGRYGFGVSRFAWAVPLEIRGFTPHPAVATAKAGQSPRPGIPRFPAAAPPPSRRALLALLGQLRHLRLAHSRPGLAVALPDDWRTEGNWLGRYGRYYADLAAWLPPDNDLHWGTGHARKFALRLLACPQIGSDHRKGDSVRRWVDWNSTANPRVLEMPAPYLDTRVYFGLGSWDTQRREAEWDDHGETYSPTAGGPGLYVGLRVPKGEFLLSIYEFNNWGHWGMSRQRDYAVTLRTEPYSYPIAQLHSLHNSTAARNRAINFSGGVWERFIVCGPAQYQLGLARNYSFNTMLQAVMLDRPTSGPFPYFSPKNKYNRIIASPTQNLRTIRAAVQRKFSLTSPASVVAGAILARLSLVLKFNPVQWAALEQQDYTQLARRLLVARPAGTKPANRPREAALGRCFYEIGLFHRWEACQMACGLFPARLVEENLRWQGDAQFTSLEDRYLVEAYLSGSCGKPPGVQPHADYFHNSVVDEFDQPGAW